MSNEDKRANQVVSSKNLSGLDVESAEYVAEFIEDVNRVEPHVDFSKPENFAKYGSAQECYDQALKWIYNEYPYDGSLKEKLEWINLLSNTFLRIKRRMMRSNTLDTPKSKYKRTVPSIDREVLANTLI